MKLQFSAGGATALTLGLAATTCAAPTPDSLTSTWAVAPPTSSWIGSVAGAASAVMSSAVTELRHATSWRLVQTAPEQQPYWTTEMGKYMLFLRGINFMDITDHQDLPLLLAQRTASAASTRAWPSKPAHRDVLTSHIFPNITAEGPKATLSKFTSFRNRYYRAQSGRDSQLWLLNKVKEVASADSSITVKEFSHTWAQNSIILHWPSTAKSAKPKPVIVISAHLDSTNFLSFLAAPGADDDGSGTATILEALRALLAAGWKPEGDYDLEWHWYSAEEGGLLGSQAVVQDYVQQGRAVRANFQQDMTAFLKPGTEEVVALVADFTDAKLTEYVERLVKEYLSILATSTKIGYAASDHASWLKAGVPAAFAVEGKYDDCNLRNIHTTSDTTDAAGFSFDHLLHFVRLTAAFAVETAGQKE